LQVLFLYPLARKMDKDQLTNFNRRRKARIIIYICGLIYAPIV
jgi:hypothetical protein